ncbi:S9 family peptidase, partial [bacterium]|nr:S9 family peptidase [bacterium]
TWGYEDRFHRMLAQRGFAIVDIDFRGSSGYGREWRTEIFRHTGGKDLDDAADAVEYCVKQGWAIAGNAGIWGWSYGGFLTNMAMFKRPDVFKVGCSVAAVYDWKNYNLEYTSQRWKDPADDAEGYAQSSPITFAAGLEGKLLLAHGMKDDNVHVQDTIQLIDKLIRLGKDFDLLLYPRERHGFSRDESDVHVMRSMMEYFEEHLK